MSASEYWDEAEHILHEYANGGIIPQVATDSILDSVSSCSYLRPIEHRHELLEAINRGELL